MAKRCQPSQNKNWLQVENNYQDNLVEDGSTASSVSLGSDIHDNDDDTEVGSLLGDEDDMTSQDVPTETVKKKCQQFKKCINIKDTDIVKFISNKSKYSQELSTKLGKLKADVELVPEKSLIIVIKKHHSRYIKDWNKRCCSIVRKFCSRFRKNCFELKDSSSVQKALPKLRRMLQWSNAAYWIESNNRLAVMTEQSECEQVLKTVLEFLENDGFKEYRSDEDELNKPSHVTKVPGKENSLKQWQICVNIDKDIANFLLKRKKYSEDLKGQLSSLSAELQILKSGLIKIKEVDGDTIPNWKERCKKTVNVFCGLIHKKYFPLEEEIRDSIPEALSTLQQDVSSTGGACWLDTHKQNLILVGLNVEFSNAEKEVDQFFEKVRRFARRSFQIESIHELVRKDLPTLKEALKSCNITLNKKTLVVVCLRNEVDDVAGKVERFFQRLQAVKRNDVGTERKVKCTKPTENQNKDKAVNNPEFAPRSFQEPLRNFAPSSSINFEEERLQVAEKFVNNKIKQLTEDPGLLDELSVFMADYLSTCITVENDMIKLSDILFEKFVSEQNIQYTASKLANYLDKFLVPKATEQLRFRTAFLKRCASENARFKAIIQTNPERTCNVAIFFGELLMNYKTNDGETIRKFLDVVSGIIKQLLQCHDKRLLICAGKLLKLTGSSLDQNDGMFVTIAHLASNPRVDKAVQILFNRVSELRRTSWGQHETTQSTAYPQPNVYGAAQSYSMYISSMQGMLEEQDFDLPVFVEEEWDEYTTDSSGQVENQDENQDKAELNEANSRMCLEQYCYVPYAKEKKKPKEFVKFIKISSDHADYIERTQFLNTLKECQPGVVVSIIEGKSKMCFKGSDEAISVAKQRCENLVKELNVVKLPAEAMQLVSRKEGLEFINNCLSNRESVYVLVVGGGSVKVVSRSPQVCKEVKECLCKNVHKATIPLPQQSEHIFASKQWYEISKTIETESLVDYQINFVQETRHDIKLHGATHLVQNYRKIITDFIDSQKIECYEMWLPSGIARFMKEKLREEIAKIEFDLKEEQVKINILSERRTCECKGTKEGICKSKRRILSLRDQITSKSKDYSAIGISTLFSENCQRNIKGIEAESNTIINVSEEPNTVEKESTQAEVEAIQAKRAQGKSKVRQETSMDPFDLCNFTTNEGLRVSWKYGSIAQERADILVSSAVRDLRNPAMVGRVMNSVGGPSFVAACCQHTNIGTGDIATTIGGNLLCKYVIHAVCCDWNSNGVAEQTLRGLLLKILLECTRFSASSVAMPLIGTGKRGFREDLVLRVMKEVFEKFSSMYPLSTLKEIKLIRYDPSGRRTTVQAAPVSGSTYQIAIPSNQPGNTFAPLVAGSSAEKIKLQVFARSSTDISSAFDEIEKFIQDHLTSKKLNDEKLFDVVLKHWNEIKLLTKDNDLKITCVDQTTVLIEGVLSKVVEAKDKLRELVSQYTGEERKSNQLSYISQNVQWYYFDRSNREVPYSTQLNGTIELARMNGEATVEITEPDGQTFVVDFSEMVAKNTSSGSYLSGLLASYFSKKSSGTKKLTRKLIRSAASPGPDLSLPSNWTLQPKNQLVQLVRILSSSQEYLEVQNHFVAQGGNACLLYKVERIQNPQLYSRYLAFKKSMRGQVNEMRLFHGTDAVNVDSINAHNFSRSFAGVNGVAYGNGVYFARNASYSMGYANRQLSGSQPKMYMAKVLVGEYTRGVKGLKAPPLKNDPNNPGLRYDSVVDHPSNPSMYIIFQDNQYYPEYLLTMR